MTPNGPAQSVESRGLLGRVFLECFSVLRSLRRTPAAGALRWISHRLLPPRTLVWVQIRNGIGRGLWLKLDPRTGYDYWSGDVEKQVQRALQEHLRPGMVVYDIGANIGFFTLVAARLVGENGKVFSFDAEPVAVQRLRENVARNGFRNITVVESAVWSKTGPITFLRADPSQSPDRGLGKVASPAQTAGSCTVSAVSLDDFVQTAPAPNVIKCDVEGAEVEVFRSATGPLDKHRPVVICETHSAENMLALQGLFSGLGYRVTLLSDNHILALPQSASAAFSG